MKKLKWVILILLICAPAFAQTWRGDSDVDLNNAEQVTNDVDGIICLEGIGGTYDEDLCFNMDATSDSVAVISNTGVNILDINMAVRGLVDITLDTEATVTLTDSECSSTVRINADNDVIDYTLPSASKGLNCVFQSTYAAVVTVDTGVTTDAIILDGTKLTDGYAIDSSGTAGDFILLAATSDSIWVSLGKSGTWVDGGED